MATLGLFSEIIDGSVSASSNADRNAAAARWLMASIDELAEKLGLVRVDSNGAHAGTSYYCQTYSTAELPEDPSENPAVFLSFRTRYAATDNGLRVYAGITSSILEDGSNSVSISPQFEFTPVVTDSTIGSTLVRTVVYARTCLINDSVAMCGFCNVSAFNLFHFGMMKQGVEGLIWPSTAAVYSNVGTLYYISVSAGLSTKWESGYTPTQAEQLKPTFLVSKAGLTTNSNRTSLVDYGETGSTLLDDVLIYAGAGVLTSQGQTYRSGQDSYLEYNGNLYRYNQG